MMGADAGDGIVGGEKILRDDGGKGPRRMDFSGLSLLEHGVNCSQYVLVTPIF